MAIGRYPSSGTIATSCTYSAACGHQQGKSPQRAGSVVAMTPACAGSDGVRDVDEDVAHAESRRQQVAQTADAERLGGVVARGHEMDLGLARASHGALDRLARHEGVETVRDRVLEVVGARARDNPDGPNPLPAVRERERLAARRGAGARDELIGPDPVAGQAARHADRRALVRAERLPALAADRAGEQRVV